MKKTIKRFINSLGYDLRRKSSMAERIASIPDSEVGRNDAIRSLPTQAQQGLVSEEVQPCSQPVANKRLLGETSAEEVDFSDAFAVQKYFIPECEETVIFDVGAAIGTVTAKYRDFFPRASIHSFEPFPHAFEHLKKATAGDARTFIHPFALSENNGKAIFHSNISMYTNSILPTDARGGSFWGEGLVDTVRQLEIDTETIDAFCLNNNIASIDILKIDVQGAEYAVLAGARHMLLSQSVALIYAEIIMAPTYRGQRKLCEYLSLLDSFGYELLDLYNPIKCKAKLIQADAIFLSNSFRDRFQSEAVKKPGKNVVGEIKNI